MPIERCAFEDDFPIMFKFYYERGKLSEFQLQKVHEIQQRWKSGLVFWLTHDNQEIEIPQWVAVNVIINNKQNVSRGSRICMSLNHTKGYGCNRLHEGTCSYVHECALCGQDDHGVFQKRQNGSWVCTRLRKWYDEEERYKALGFGDPRKHEDTLTELARRPRPAKAAPSRPKVAAVVKDGQEPRTAWGKPKTGPHADSPDAKAAPLQQVDVLWPKLATICSDGTNGDRPSQPGSPRRSPPMQPPPPRLPQNWQAIWCDEQQLYYFWNATTNETTWEAPELDAGTLEAARAAVLRARSSQVSGRSLAKEDFEDRLPDHSIVNGHSKDANKLRAISVGTYVCTQHWRPQSGVESCLRVFHGERLVVTYADGQVGGWAYGHVVGDESQAGYFPQAVLLAAGQRAPRLLAAGESCVVAERFVAPEEVAGYLSVAPGDALRVLHGAELPGAWIYVERAALFALGAPTGGACGEVGWVPTCVLKGFSDAIGCQDMLSPHPAG